MNFQIIENIRGPPKEVINSKKKKKAKNYHIRKMVKNLSLSKNREKRKNSKDI